MDNKKHNTDENQADQKLPGYPHYPAREDIYNQEEKTSFDEDVPQKIKTTVENEPDTAGAESGDHNQTGEQDDENK